MNKNNSYKNEKLKTNLDQPFCNVDDILKRHEVVKWFRCNKIVVLGVEKCLKDVPDVEKVVVVINDGNCVDNGGNSSGVDNVMESGGNNSGGNSSGGNSSGVESGIDNVNSLDNNNDIDINRKDSNNINNKSSYTQYNNNKSSYTQSNNITSHNNSSQSNNNKSSHTQPNNLSNNILPLSTLKQHIKNTLNLSKFISSYTTLTKICPRYFKFNLSALTKKFNTKFTDSYSIPDFFKLNVNEYLNLAIQIYKEIENDIDVYIRDVGFKFVYKVVNKEGVKVLVVSNSECIKYKVFDNVNGNIYNDNVNKNGSNVYSSNVNGSGSTNYSNSSFCSTNNNSTYNNNNIYNNNIYNNSTYNNSIYNNNIYNDTCNKKYKISDSNVTRFGNSLFSNVEYSTGQEVELNNSRLSNKSTMFSYNSNKENEYKYKDVNRDINKYKNKDVNKKNKKSIYKNKDINNNLRNKDIIKDINNKNKKSIYKNNDVNKKNKKSIYKNKDIINNIKNFLIKTLIKIFLIKTLSIILKITTTIKLTTTT
ncbi:hypothetical protein NAPIS_ORF02280 [Vairimorpha apis BRL 01]|uniref:Uncharacterized protein n=1 Tax=Vairimorpha apis BRL 01 TaxID=1037528 RepID=T0L6L2_9MICR|nr:hypothetical protein NAPIS_ORF02280 [Vairimorpha apis BRL 01]